MGSQVMICINAVYLGVDADYNEAANIYDAAWVYIVSENIFCCFFSFELLVRFLAFQSVWDCFRDGWMRFDFFLVATMILETWILMVLLKLLPGSGSVSIPVGPLRLLRLLKLTRMARMMRAFPELVTLVKGMARSLRATCGCFVLILAMLYTFSIVVHMLMKHESAMNDTLQEKMGVDLGTLPHCMWTLLTCGVTMDNFSRLATYLVFDGKFNVALAGWTFTLFALLTTMTVLQMLIGVLCEVVGDTTKEKAAAKNVAIMKSQIVERLRRFDDGDGLITQIELAKIMQDPHSKKVLRSLNINELFLLQMLKMAYPRPDSAVAFKPLTEIMLMCIGDSPATVETMAGGISYMINEVQELQTATESRLANLEAELTKARA